MRRTLLGMVAAAVVLVPVWAMAGEREVMANKIAVALRESGQLQNYKIGVSYQDGTAWLRGQVSDQQQMNAALGQVAEVPGVRRVVNGLNVASTDKPACSTTIAPPKPTILSKLTQTRPLRQPSGALSADGKLSLTVSAPTAAARRTAAPSRTATRIEQASSAQSQIERLASSFVTEPVHTTAGAVPLERPTTVLRPTRTLQPMVVSQPKFAPRPTRAPVTTRSMVSAPPLAMAPSPLGNSRSPRVMRTAMNQPAIEPSMSLQPQYATTMPSGMPPAQYDQPNMPNHAWPSYAPYPNYAALTYPKQYSPTAWPYIGPFYPYPQVPLGWRKVALEWHDGWWQLDFDDAPRNQWSSGLFRPFR